MLTRRFRLYEKSWSAVPRDPRTIALTVAVVVCSRGLSAQVRGDAPIAPASTIGPVTEAATLSVLGIAAIPDGSGNRINQRNDLWLGATQPIGNLGRVRFAALANGNWRVPDGVRTNASLEGTVALRARARVGQQRVWSALSYGHASMRGNPTAELLGTPVPTSMTESLLERSGMDTTVSRRVDVGAIGRAEAGIVTHVPGFELSFGMSVERASRTTSQTLSFIDIDAPPAPLGQPRTLSRLSSTSRKHRDVVSSIASVGFHTGPTTWLVSVTAPVAARFVGGAQRVVTDVPTVASVAVVQPVTAWLSVVGAAATNAATVGTIARLEGLSADRARSFAPVLAIGVRFSRAANRDAVGTPTGVLAFETRTLGAVDSVSVARGVSGPDGDTLRVVVLIDAPRAESVELMGDATDWTVTQMRRLPNGRWRAELKLARGVHRIIVRSDGGAWLAPPGLPVGNDDYGSPVGMIVIRGKP